jgi:group I intron endonuclease
MEAYKVYLHRFPNGKVYVGITKQQPEIRWQYGGGYRSNSYMSFAIKKYGWENVEHEILADFLTEEEACEMEVLLIKKYKSNIREYGYNIREGGNLTKLSDESRQKLSESKKGQKQSEETRNKRRESMRRFMENNPNFYKDHPEFHQKAVDAAAEKSRKKVAQYDMDGNLIAVWQSIREAERVLGINHKGIGNCCKHLPRFKSAGGYRWEYAD